MISTYNPLHGLSALYLRVWEQIDERLGDDGEIPFDLKLCLDAVEGDMKEGWEELAKIIAEYNRLSEGCDEEIKRLTARKDAAERKATRLKAYILDAMETAGFKKYEGKTFTISVKSNPPAVQIYDKEAIPNEFCETRMELFVSKTAIANKIKAAIAEAEATSTVINPDEIVPGAKLVVGKQLLIK